MHIFIEDLSKIHCTILLLEAKYSFIMRLGLFDLGFKAGP